jgi:hypothetical protein
MEDEARYRQEIGGSVDRMDGRCRIADGTDGRDREQRCDPRNGMRTTRRRRCAWRRRDAGSADPKTLLRVVATAPSGGLTIGELLTKFSS